MRRIRLVFAALAFVTWPAHATYHTWVIEQLYSNADGNVQFVVLHEAQGANGENLLAGHALVVTRAGSSRTFTFDHDLPDSATANRRVLIATPGFAARNIDAPDYVIPARFLPADGGVLDYAGVDAVMFASLPTDGVHALARGGASVTNAPQNFAGQTDTLAAGPITVVEYYNSALDHYFMSPLAPDIDALDSGRTPGWTRTGWQFDAYPTAAAAPAATSPVCRFYIPPEHGDSHFFSASPTECATVAGKVGTDPNYSGYIYESPAAFYIALPDVATGACPAATVPVYRLWNQRADSNHRYAVTDAVRSQMVSKGYVSEGYGPSGVAMCTPRIAVGDSLARLTGATPFFPGCDGAPVTGTVYAGAEVEPMIAVSPAASSRSARYVATWQQDRWSDGGARGLLSAYSLDGLSWATSQAKFSRCTGGNAANGGDYARATDPWVTFTAGGTALSIAVAFTGDTFAAGSSSAVLVSRSTDGGATWSDPSTLRRDGADGFNDKDSITGDRLVPGYAYATWDRIVPSGNGPTWFARTTNDGVSWEPARAIYDPGARSQTLNNQIVVIPPGAGFSAYTLFDFFTQIDTAPSGSQTTRLAVIRSMDQGISWAPPVFIADIQAVGTHDPETGVEIRDGATLGSFGGGTNGKLAAVWQDARFSAGARDGIAFATSEDGGTTWSPPVQVNAVPGVQALLPAITIRDDGMYGVLYYDMRNNTADASTLLIDAWLATSNDGLTWREQHLAGPFDLSNAPRAEGGLFIGDYQGLVSDGSEFVPIFIETNPNTAATDRTDAFAGVMRSIPSRLERLQAAPVMSYAAKSAPAFVITDDIRKRLQQAIERAQERRRVGARAPTP